MHDISKKGLIMSYRSQALNSNAFQKLLYAYEHPDESLLSIDKPLVWMLGIDAPEEVILAADMIPAKIMGYYGDSMPYADKFLEFSFGPIWRRIFEKIARLSVAGKMKYLACSASSDMNYKIYNYIEEIRRKGYIPYLPDTYYIDFELGYKDVRAQERNETVVEGFIHQVEQWSNKKMERSDLERAIILCNEYRMALRNFNALREGEDSHVTGSEALAVIGGAMFMEKEVAIELLKQLTEEAGNWPSVAGKRVYFTGCFQENTEVYNMIEQAGGNVVFEDHEMGARYFDTDVNTNINPVFGIADRHFKRLPSAERSTTSVRAEVVARMVSEKNIEKFLLYMNTKDECWIWDYPKQKVILDQRGVSSLVIERQEYPIRGKEQLQVALNQFFDDGKGC